MNNTQRTALIILTLCLVIFFLSGCAGYDLVWNTGVEQVTLRESK